MKEIKAIVEKDLKETIFKHKQLKQYINDMKECLSKYQIPFLDKTDFDYFKDECIYVSIQNKEAIESAYEIAYASMYDYWNSLLYQERKRLINVDINQALEKLPSFLYQEQNIYIPMFDQRFNTLYELEMASFDLKQYMKLMKEFKMYIYPMLYGEDYIKSSFCSARFILSENQHYSMYHDISKRLYMIEEDNIAFCISFSKEMKEEELLFISAIYYQKEIHAFVEALIQLDCLHKKTKKRLMKYLKNKMKEKR